MIETEDDPNTADNHINWQERAADLEATLAQLHERHRMELATASLRQEAISAGIIDLDGLKLIESDELAAKSGDNTLDARQVIRALKKNKPWLFGVASNSSSIAPLPNCEPMTGRSAQEMSDAEWRAARARLVTRK